MNSFPGCKHNAYLQFTTHHKFNNNSSIGLRILGKTEGFRVLNALIILFGGVLWYYTKNCCFGSWNVKKMLKKKSLPKQMR